MKLLKLLRQCWNGSRGEVELEHAIRFLKKYDSVNQDAIYILRNLKLELRQEWMDSIREILDVKET